MGSGGNVYQVVHQNPRPAETQTVQIISGSQLQAINGQIVTKSVQQQEQHQHEEEQAAAAESEAATVTTSQQSGLTITPVSATAAPSAARPQQTVAVSGVQPGQIIQVKNGLVVGVIFCGCFCYGLDKAITQKERAFNS